MLPQAVKWVIIIEIIILGALLILFEFGWLYANAGW